MAEHLEPVRPPSPAGQRKPSPLISLIIPVYNIEDYLAECLDSITRQAFRDIEIIAVDGASTDSSGKILDERRQSEPRLAVVPSDEVIGPGRARNIGAKCATGEYLWFVDGDDVISDGSLARIAESIEATRPDVLFVDYDGIDSAGNVEPGHEHGLIRDAPSECFTLAEQPWAINLSMASWNKVIKREFFLSTGAEFSVDWPHEDVPVSCLILLDAGRINVLNRVCYRYRIARPGSATAAGKRKRHFNIFCSYGIVLDDAGKRASNGDPMITGQVQRALFRRAIWHYTTILDTGGAGIRHHDEGAFIAQQDRREFFEKMHWDFVRYKPPEYRNVRGARGIKFRLVEKNAYRAYCALEPANRLRVRAARVVSRRLARGRR
jgi:CDP-glycerol glycerophosphotransferase